MENPPNGIETNATSRLRLRHDVAKKESQIMENKLKCPCSCDTRNTSYILHRLNLLMNGDPSMSNLMNCSCFCVLFCSDSLFIEGAGGCKWLKRFFGTFFKHLNEFNVEQGSIYQKSHRSIHKHMHSFRWTPIIPWFSFIFILGLLHMQEDFNC